MSGNFRRRKKGKSQHIICTKNTLISNSFIQEAKYDPPKPSRQLMGPEGVTRPKTLQVMVAAAAAAAVVVVVVVVVQ